MEPTTRGHSSSLGPGILEKGNPGSQNGLTKERKFITVFIALDLSVGVFLLLLPPLKCKAAATASLH
jgi:hypothetical protein